MAKLEIHTDLLPRSAGRIMVTEIPAVAPDATIAEVERALLEHAKKLDTINYIYVLSKEKKLEGVLSIKELFRLPKSAAVAPVMKRNLVTVRPHTDEGRVALLAIEHDLKEIPVVDGENHFLGVVPYDVILHILREEHIEDALRSAGIHQFNEPAKAILNASAFTLFKKRVPWLLVGLGGTAITAGIIGYFEHTLETQLLLAAFIPAVTYLSGAVGTQSETLFIRAAALDRSLSIKNYLEKDLMTGLFLATTLALVMGIISFFIWREISVSYALTASIFFATLISMVIAVLLPWSFARFRFDPAILGGPLDTIVSDVLSIAVYFSFANLILSWLA